MFSIESILLAQVVQAARRKANKDPMVKKENVLQIPHNAGGSCQSYECGITSPFDENFYDFELKKRGLTLVQIRQFIRRLNKIAEENTASCMGCTGCGMIMCGVFTCTCCCVYNRIENVTNSRLDKLQTFVNEWNASTGAKHGVEAICCKENRKFKEVTAITKTGKKYRTIQDIYVDFKLHETPVEKASPKMSQSNSPTFPVSAYPAAPVMPMPAEGQMAGEPAKPVSHQPFRPNYQAAASGAWESATPNSPPRYSPTGPGQQQMYGYNGQA